MTQVIDLINVDYNSSIYKIKDVGVQQCETIINGVCKLPKPAWVDPIIMFFAIYGITMSAFLLYEIHRVGGLKQWFTNMKNYFKPLLKPIMEGEFDED